MLFITKISVLFVVRKQYYAQMFKSVNIFFIIIEILYDLCYNVFDRKRTYVYSVQNDRKETVFYDKTSSLSEKTPARKHFRTSFQIP